MPPREYAYAVDVSRTEPDPTEPDDSPGWIAEGGLSGDSSCVAFEWTESLAELVAEVEEEVAGWRKRYPNLPIVWRLDGDEQHMADAAAAGGITLPR
jgi:hypothetical protein